MSSSSTIEKPAANPGKTKVEKAQSYLSLVGTGIGIAGAVGTGLVWLITTFFLGDVQILPDKNADSVCVKVIDKRGQASLYFSKDVQLMPGKYHLEIGLPDQKPSKFADVDVKLWNITQIPWAVPAQGQTAVSSDDHASVQPQQAALNASDSGDGQHKRWWQFWKRGDR